MSVPLSRIVAGLAIAAGVAVLYAPRVPAVAGGLMLGFVLPGLALLAVLFRRRALTVVERTVLTPALSMGVLILTGLLLHGTGLRIERLSWTVATVVVTLAAVVAARLQPASPAPAAALPRTGVSLASLMVIPAGPVPPRDDEQQGAARAARRGQLLRQYLPLLLIAGVLGGAGWLSYQTSRITHETVVTALSAAPPGPVDAVGNRTVRVSATGLLAADGPYTVTVTGPSGTTASRRTVRVTGDGTWSAAVSMPAAQRMTVRLFRVGDTTAYRTLLVSAVD